MKTRILATFAIASVLALGVATPAFASESYTGALSANSAAPGGTVEYTSDNTGQPDGTGGSYSLSGAQTTAAGGADIQLASTVTHSIRVGAHSQLKFAVTVPKNAKPGSTYTLTVEAGKFADKQSIRIAGVAPSAAASFSPVWIVLVLAILIVLALIVVVLARRRNNAKAA